MPILKELTPRTHTLLHEHGVNPDRVGGLHHSSYDYIPKNGVAAPEGTEYHLGRPFVPLPRPLAGGAVLGVYREETAVVAGVAPLSAMSSLVDNILSQEAERRVRQAAFTAPSFVHVDEWSAEAPRVRTESWNAGAPGGRIVNPYPAAGMPGVIHPTGSNAYIFRTGNVDFGSHWYTGEEPAQ